MNCRSCEAPILWAETAAGKSMPLDEKPDPNGTFVFVNGKTRRAEPLDVQLKRPLYTSHFATCPEAAQWRKGNR